MPSLCSTGPPAGWTAAACAPLPGPPAAGGGRRQRGREAGPQGRGEDVHPGDAVEELPEDCGRTAPRDVPQDGLLQRQGPRVGGLEGALALVAHEAVGIGPDGRPRLQAPEPQLGPGPVEDREDGQHSVGGGVER
eukprot:561703-Alexandrium_andersonii.AAC.1